MKSPAISRISVIGCSYSMINRQAVVDFLLKRSQESAGRPVGYVCVSNVHTTMTGVLNPRYREILNDSLLTVPDGVPLVWAMRSLGAKGQDRVRGPTLMRDLMDQGRRVGAKHYLIGGAPAALEALQKTLKENYPGADIVGMESPPFKPLEAIADDEWRGQAERINASGAHFVWVGLGAPKQERWMGRQQGSVSGIMLGVGAAFDLIPGRIPEAPIALQRVGLEWLYRFYREPRRLWRRYIFNNPVFLLLWGAQLAMRVCGMNFVREK
jgi:N-acetylglucosaminyldiphosphoundecaprenol N-acetyl-beta-D-mannosaminyltransferase